MAGGKSNRRTAVKERRLQTRPLPVVCVGGPRGERVQAKGFIGLVAVVQAVLVQGVRQRRHLTLGGLDFGEFEAIEHLGAHIAREQGNDQQDDHLAGAAG